MTEDEAREWIIARFGTAAEHRLTRFAALVLTEADRQNLVARSTLGTIWSRHIVDSAQLIEHAQRSGGEGLWLDIGTGAGFPGMVVAILTERPVLLIEPRRKRAVFLLEAATSLGVRVETLCSSIEAVPPRPCATISARAVASIPKLLENALPWSTLATLWVLPRGRGAREEVASAQAAWHGVFHVEQSITDPDSLIVLASKVSRR